MFKKVLIAEDHGITGSGIQRSLGNLSIPEIVVSHYCDDALLKLKGAKLQNEPFELLITDLSFKEDYKKQELRSGEDLIIAAKKIQPDLKFLVYSVEHRIGKIKSLFEVLNIHGFVGKERKDFNEIERAVKAISEGHNYTSAELNQSLRNSDNLLELDDYDIMLLKLLTKGMRQEEVAGYFQEKKYPASSLRSIQDRLGRLKTIFGAKTPIQLVAQALDRGFI